MEGARVVGGRGISRPGGRGGAIFAGGGAARNGRRPLAAQMKFLGGRGARIASTGERGDNVRFALVWGGGGRALASAGGEALAVRTKLGGGGARVGGRPLASQMKFGGGGARVAFTRGRGDDVCFAWVRGRRGSALASAGGGLIAARTKLRGNGARIV